MNEHDDDLESEVHEGADEELNSFPDTGDELIDTVDDAPGDDQGDTPLDDDEAEI